MAIPRIPERLRSFFDKEAFGFYDWARDLIIFLSIRFDTKGDVNFLTNGKGPIVKNKAGTVVKRAFLNDAGNDWDFEDP
jgi:hypothetical protein